jgi:hypothetical protein
MGEMSYTKDVFHEFKVQTSLLLSDEDVVDSSRGISVVDVLRAKTKVGPWTFTSTGSHWCSRQLVVHGVTPSRDGRGSLGVPGSIIVYSGQKETSKTTSYSDHAFP